MSTLRIVVLLFALLGVSPHTVRVYAADSHPHSREPDKAISHDELRRLVREGKVLSLAALKVRVLAEHPGELIYVSVDRDDDRIIYEFRILRDSGQVTEVEVDAASGKIVEIENE